MRDRAPRFCRLTRLSRVGAALAVLLLLHPWRSAGQGAIEFTDSGQDLTSIGGNNSFDVALGDLDGNGHIDAVVAQGSGFGAAQPNVIWLNDGTGRFSESPQFIGEGDSRSVALADLNGNGYLDLFIANAGAGEASHDEIWINQGGGQGGQPGTFLKWQELANGSSHRVRLGDLNGNGAPDAIVIGSQQQIWWNDGNGSFTPGPVLDVTFANDVALGDLDGDGNPDLVFAGEGIFFPSRVFWNEWNDQQAFVPGPTLITEGVNNGVAIGDLDSDGRPDIYLVTSAADVVWWNNGDRTFTRGADIGETNDSDVVLGDFDGDGDLDAFICRFVAAQGNLVWANNGDRTFTTTGLVLGNGSSRRAAVADLDGDGKLDVFVANSGPNKVWLNRSRVGPPPEERVRPFRQSAQTFPDRPVYAVALGRIDADSLPDAVLAGFGGVELWLNGADGIPGRFELGQELDSGWAQAVALGDLDGDGDLDAVVAYFGGEYDFQVWINEGGTFVPGQAVSGRSPNPEGIALADLDGDGNLDIVMASAFGSRIWFNGLGTDPPGTFSPSPQELPAATRVAVGDLNGNQLPDVVLSGWVGITIWLNAQAGDRPGTFRRHQTISRQSQDLALGDLDGDGDLDAFVLFGGGEPAEIWWNGEEGDPPGTFRDSGQHIDSADGIAVVLGDLNGNGHLDAVIGIGSRTVRSQSDLIWINDGTGHGRLTSQCLGSDLTLAVALADLDGDGDLDLLVGHFNGGAVWLNNEGEVCFCIVDWLQNLAATESLALLEFEPGEGVADVYRALRDRVFVRSAGGRRLARLYDRHNAEIFSLILANGHLREKAWSTLEAWAPHVQALLEGEGEEVIIAESQADAVASFLDALSALASTTLAEVIQIEREALEVASLSGQTLNAVLERVESRSSPRPEIRLEYQGLSDGTGIELRWMTEADRSYRVTRSVGGLDDFSPIGLPMIGNGQVLRYPVPFSPGQQAMFFQIQSRPLKF